jgi:hypothetical protein
MPAARINRSKIEDVVAKYASLAAAAGLDWPTVERLSEAALERHLVGGRAVMDQIQWWGCSRGRSPTP